MKSSIDDVRWALPCLALFIAWTTYGQSETGMTPNAWAEKMVQNPAFEKNARGESFCWHARVGMDRFVEKYKMTQNTEWLDAGIQYYDFLISKMDTDPDGYKGWIGPYMYDTDFWQDSHVGDAILLTSILDFSVLALENKSLKKKYGDKAQSYVELAKKHFVEKYDRRGTWKEDGPYGAYVGFNKFLTPGDLTQWVIGDNLSRVGISHPFNKQMDAAQVCLRLYRVTGNAFYRDRAERIFFTVKSHFQYHDNHYHWNYYEPLTAGDMDVVKNETRHWVGVHPFRSGYQAGEVSKIVEAYHYGIVFTEEDIKRIVRTNLQVMWNQDKENPQFINSNHLGPQDDTTGLAAFKRQYDHANVSKNMGELWAGLLDFDPTIRELYELRFKDNKNPQLYLQYKSQILANPPGFERKYAKGKVKIPVIEFSESKDLYLATLFPYKVSKGETVMLVCKSFSPGELKIDVYSRQGKKLENLFTGTIGQDRTFIYVWDGKEKVGRKPYSGEYKIRWSVGNGYREFPVVFD